MDTVKLLKSPALRYNRLLLDLLVLLVCSVLYSNQMRVSAFKFFCVYTYKIEELMISEPRAILIAFTVTLSNKKLVYVSPDSQICM